MIGLLAAVVLLGCIVYQRRIIGSLRAKISTDETRVMAQQAIIAATSKRIDVMEAEADKQAFHLATFERLYGPIAGQPAPPALGAPPAALDRETVTRWLDSP